MFVDGAVVIFPIMNRRHPHGSVGNEDSRTKYLRECALIRCAQRAYDQTPFSASCGRRVEKPAVIQRIRHGTTPGLERNAELAHLL